MGGRTGLNVGIMLQRMLEPKKIMKYTVYHRGNNDGKDNNEVTIGTRSQQNGIISTN